MPLRRLRQMALKIEDTPGTFDTAVLAAAYAGHLIRDASLEPDVTLYSSDALRGTLTPVEGVPTRQAAKASFGIEMRGASSGTTPAWDVAMQGCGMTSRELVKVTAGTSFAISGGPLRHGQTISQATGTTRFSGKVFGDVYNGATSIYLYDCTGVINTSTNLTGSSPSVTVTPTGNWSATYAAGRGWAPATYKTWMLRTNGSALTGGTVAVGDVLTGGTSTAKAVVSEVYGYFMTVTSVSGTVAVGDECVGGTSSARAYVYEVVTTSTFRVIITSGSFTGTEALTFYHRAGSSATATRASESQHEFVVRPYKPTPFSNGETVSVGGVSFTAAASAATVQRDMPTLSGALYEDGVVKKATGMRGTLTLNAKVGEPGMLSFDFTGAWQGVADAQNLSGVTYALQAPPVFLSAGALLGTESNPTVAPSYAPRFSSLSLNLGHAVVYREDANASSGVLEASITGRAGSGSIDPELDLEASYPALTNLLAGNGCNFSCYIGTTLTNKFRVSCPGILLSGAPSADRNGEAVRTLNFSLTGGHYENSSDTPGSENDLLIAYLVA